jgi:two-component system, OmpR family, response regulator
MKFRAYIVEDSPTIRENLIETLQELALVDAVGTAETEHEGKKWLAQNEAYWDLAIIDLFLKEGSGLPLPQAGAEDGGSEQSRDQRRALALRAAGRRCSVR